MTVDEAHPWSGEVAAQRDGFSVHPEIAALRDSARTAPTTTPFGYRATMVCGHAEARELLGDPRRFRLDQVPAPPELVAAGVSDEEHRASLTGSLLVQDPPDHTRLRKMLTGEFTANRIQRLIPRVEQIVEEHLDAMEQTGPPAELLEDFALPIPAMVICEFLGVPFSDRAAFTERSARIVDGRLPAPERRKANLAQRAYIADLVARQRRDPGDDLLGMLVREHSADLTDAELVGIGNLLLIAGHETTSNMLSLGTLALLEHPDQLARVRDDPQAVRGAVEELLRWVSVVHGCFPRVATEDTTIGGHHVAAGELVIASLAGANRDPALLEGGEHFDIGRPSIPHLAFGHGIHHCLGAPLARLEMQVAFPALLRRFPGLHLAGEPGFRHGTLIYGLDRLPVRW